MKQAIYFDNDITELEQLSQTQTISKGTLISASIADLHFPVNNIGPKMQFTILDEQFLQKIEGLPKLDVVYILGDLYEHKVLASSDAMLYANMFVAKLIELCKNKNATLIIIQGTLSHDANQLKSYYHYMYDPTVDVRIITRPQFEYVKNARILCIPEMYGMSESIYHQLLHESGFYDMAIMHGMFAGAVAGNETGASRLFHIEDFDNCRGPILAGHVHQQMCIKEHFYYCGSPYQWKFDDEDGKKGFVLTAMNLDTGRYYLDRIEIKSFVYKTISIDAIANNDPQVTIAYIDRLKKESGIDYIRIQFNTPIGKVFRMILSNNYRENQNVKIEFPNTEEELVIRHHEDQINADMGKFKFVMDPHIPDEEKLCRYINLLKEDENYMTVDELIHLLEDV